MIEITFQNRSEAKIRWAVKVFCKWRDVKLDNKCCPDDIRYANLCDTYSLTKENLNMICADSVLG